MNVILTSLIDTEQNNRLTEQKTQGIIPTQSQKTIAEPRNSTLSQTANSNTPLLNRVIFVCSFFTPQERLERQSMVACNRKGSPFAVYRLEQFSSLLHVTAKSLETLAVAVYQIQTEQIAMIFKFFCVNRTTPHYQEEIISIIANNEQEARFKLTADYRLLLDRPIARFSTKGGNA